MKGRKKGPNIYTFARYRIWLQLPAIPLFAYRWNLHCKYDPLDFWIPRERREQGTHTQRHICTYSITMFPIRVKLQTQHGVLLLSLYSVLSRAPTAQATCKFLLGNFMLQSCITLTTFFPRLSSTLLVEHFCTSNRTCFNRTGWFTICGDLTLDKQLWYEYTHESHGPNTCTRRIKKKDSLTFDTLCMIS